MYPFPEVQLINNCNFSSKPPFAGEEPLRSLWDGEIDGYRSPGSQGGKWDADHAEGGGDKPGEDQVRRISCIFPNPGCDRAAAEEMQTCSTTIVLKYLQV